MLIIYDPSGVDKGPSKATVVTPDGNIVWKFAEPFELDNLRYAAKGPEMADFLSQCLSLLSEYFGEVHDDTPAARLMAGVEDLLTEMGHVQKNDRL